MRLGRADWQLWPTIAAVVVAGAVVTYRLPGAPLVPFWLSVSLFGGVWIAVDPRFGALQARMRRLLVMYAVLMPVALLSTQFAARRQATAAHLQYRGVQLELADSVSIGSGAVEVDIRFPTLSESQLPWRLALYRGESGWSVDAPVGAELVKIHTGDNDGAWSSSYEAVNGVVLEEDGDRAVVLGPEGQPVDTLVLRTDEGPRRLVTSRGPYGLDPPDGRIEHRYERMLDAGTRLGALPGDRPSDLLVDQLVRVQRIPADHAVGPSTVGWLGRATDRLPGGEGRRRVLVSATAPFRIADPAGPGAPEYPLRDSTRIEVRHDGGRWAFDVEVQRATALAREGLSVRFVRNPRPMDTPLPTGTSCPDGVACGLLSLRRLPTPIPHISLETAGFDGSRYGLLARLVDEDGGITAFLPRESMEVEEEGRGVSAIPVHAYAAEAADTLPTHLRPGYAVLVSSSSKLLDEPLPLLFAALGVFFLLLLVTVAAGASTPEAPPGAWEHRRWALVLGVNAVLSLLLVRLVFGARVSFFEPYLEAGLETAIGLVVASAVVCVGLLGWSGWAPRTLAFVKGHDSPRSAFRALVDGAPSALASFGTGMGGTRSALLLLGGLSAGFIFMTSPRALLFGAVCGTAVVGVWYAVAWVGAFSAPTHHTYPGSAFEVVQYSDWRTADPNRFPRAEAALALMALLWAVILIDVALGLLMLAIALLGARRLGGRGKELREALGTRTALMLGASTVALGVIAEVGSNGAVSAFLLVTLLVLLSVRFGRRLAADHAAGGRSSGGEQVGNVRTLALVLGPVVLLLPLALIDMGLLLVMILPIALAPLMAMGWRRLRLVHWGVVGVSALLLGLLVVRVLAPDLSALQASSEVGTEVKTERFEELQTIFGVRLPLIDGSMNRVAARAVAARAASQSAAEELLLWARPGPARDLLIPSIEQAWASRAYAASGAGGEGMGEAPVGLGIAEAVSYAENTFSVFVLYEHGFVAGAMVLLQYGLIAFAVLMILTATRESRDSQRAGQALFVAGVLIVVMPACYVALSNIGVLPITGQNMPFLGLNAWSDVTLCAAVIGVLMMGCMQTEMQAGGPV